MTGSRTMSVAPSLPSRIGLVEWGRYGPFLAQLVVTRRCNLTCGYCNEYDRVSPPVPLGELLVRLEKLWSLRTWAVCLTGGEPTLHPDIAELVAAMRRLGFPRRMMITNGYRLTPQRIEALGEAGLTDLQISIDGVRPNETTKKVLDALRPKLELLRRHARFRVVVNGVIGSSPPREALEVVETARACGFDPRILLVHDEKGCLDLSPEEVLVYAEVKRRIGRRAREAHDYRDRLIESGTAPFKCRAGARYLYVDECGEVHWCSQTRGLFHRPLMSYTSSDLAEQFAEPKPCAPGCTVGCVRTASAYDQWRPQRARGALGADLGSVPKEVRVR